MVNTKIYLAGPEVFLPEFGRAVFDAKKTLCLSYGFVGVSPMDGELDLTGLSPFAQGVGIYRANLLHMQQCDAIIANMTPFRSVSMDVGSAFEMGYMAASAKPVLGYTHVTSPFEDRAIHYYDPGCRHQLETYSTGTSIERFGMADNLMMVGAVEHFGFSVQQVAVPSGEEMTSLAGFEMCLGALRKALQRRP
jgi:nucleoside 2-deoxyribosyltransferase